jgi:dTMP kinase
MHSTSSCGKLIVFEGLDGAGKSTIATRLMTMLQQEDRCNVILTRQPGGTDLGKTIRTLLHREELHQNPEAEFLLFAADRALHVRNVIHPALQRGTIVICDRMTDSSLVYQGYGRGVDRTIIQTVNDWIMHGIKPDLTIYLVIDYTTAQQRIAGRPGNGTYDNEQSTFFRIVAKGYEELYTQRSDVMRIDATLPIETIVHRIYQHVCALIGCDHDTP